MVSGDLVQLKSGGPVMTVAWINREDVGCTWFDEKNELQNSNFRAPQLKVVDDTD
ncbi:YodC family protein [Qipengyuania sp.]|uniref:YodC family protein n=1 Tax=Qipengyuania sp. TaxID=2004515 RepID=UPI003AF6FF68